MSGWFYISWIQNVNPKCSTRGRVDPFCCYLGCKLTIILNIRASHDNHNDPTINIKVKMQLPLHIYVQVHIIRLINGTHYMFKNKFKKFKLYMIILQLFYFMKLIMIRKKCTLFQLILLFSGAYVKYFISKRDGTLSTTLSSVVALSVTLLTTALIPVDVFLVSFMKKTDGTFKVII